MALSSFVAATGTDSSDALTDLLVDLMHWCDFNAHDFENALRIARDHYEWERKYE